MEECGAPAWKAMLWTVKAHLVERRKLNLKAKIESSISHFSFKRLIPGGFNLGFKRSTCSALPWR